jgi:hypothetical protein
MASQNERRQAVRIAVHGNLTVEDVQGGGEALELIDVGTGGFAVASQAPLPIDAIGSYRFATTDKKWNALFRARALHGKVLPAEGQTPRRYLTGFMFVSREATAVQREIMALLDHAMNYVPFS